MTDIGERLAYLEANHANLIERFDRAESHAEERGKKQREFAETLSVKLDQLNDNALRQQGFLKGIKFAAVLFWTLTGGVILLFLQNLLNIR